MTTAMTNAQGFTAEQLHALEAAFAPYRNHAFIPYVGMTPGGLLTASPALGGANGAEEPKEETLFGTPYSMLCKEEKWKLENDALQMWDRMMELAARDQFPEGADMFLLKYHGLFFVAPAQEALMLRTRIAGGRLTSEQMRGLADIAKDYGGGYADITTRANTQIREIKAKDIINVLTRLENIGLTSRGAGADNIRNVTASPTAGFDPQELIDVMPLARAFHHYVLNHRDLYGLPRKFNVAFDGGGAVSAAADTNDIGFFAVRVGEGRAVPPGVYFRAQVAGITGHKQFASDSGILIKPEECIATAVAMIRVFVENGDRTNRKRARLKYLIDKWGVEKFIAKTQEKLAFPLTRLPLEECEPRPQVRRHGHYGVFRQSQPRMNYIGVAIPVGRLLPAQMRSLADIADRFGSGELRLTVFQNLLIPNVPDDKLSLALDAVCATGFDYRASAITGGLVACTGNTGCRFASTNTKGQAVALAKYLESKLELDLPINIHLTGCPNSCAQHYVGDIGLLGTRVPVGDELLEGYNVVLGGAMDGEQGLAREVFPSIPFKDLPALLERVLRTYLARRKPGETFLSFTRRHEITELKELFAAS